MFFMFLLLAVVTTGCIAFFCLMAYLKMVANEEKRGFWIKPRSLASPYIRTNQQMQ